MATGLKGTFVISWSQTEIEGIPAGELDSLSVGATWRWVGQAIRVDGPDGLAVLNGSNEVADLHARAARNVRRMFHKIPGVKGQSHLPDVSADPLMDNSFTVTDGETAWRATYIAAGLSHPGLIMFVDQTPPQGKDLWVVRQDITDRAEQVAEAAARAGGVICFTAGTRILTNDGLKLVEHLMEGDQIQTKDDGFQPIRWKGARQMTGARLHAMPHLRPIRIKTGALGPDIPDGDLLVSPSHRIVIRGPAAIALFNTHEVLIKARDLVGVPGVLNDVHLREATYVHVMLDRHQVLFANGVETESFHPQDADMSTLNPDDRTKLLEAMPELEQHPDTYGHSARRPLSASEAAILRHDTKWRVAT